MISIRAGAERPAQDLYDGRYLLRLLVLLEYFYQGFDLEGGVLALVVGTIAEAKGRKGR